MSKQLSRMLATSLRPAWLLVWMLIHAGGYAANDLRLVEAVKNKDQVAALALLDQHADVNAAQADGTTGLMWAAHWDMGEVADRLISAGANPNAANEYGATGLFLSCVNHSASMVGRLIRAGANPNAALSRTGQTVLMTCSQTGNADAVKALLEKGAAVNVAESRRGQTALMWAVEQNHLEATKVLLDHGADARARSKTGFTPLLFAARNGNVEIGKLLLQAGSDVNESTQEDGSALVVSTASAHTEFSIYLLEKGANPNATDWFGFTPLHNAIQKGLADVSSAQYHAAFVPPPNLPELAKALLDHGADPNARVKTDYPDHTRAPFRQTNPISLIGATPFFLAAAAGDAGLMRILVDKGANPSLSLADDTTPLMAAAGAGRVQDFSADEEPHSVDAVKLALELGANVNATNRSGQTALHAAAFTGVNGTVQLLADHGANVNPRDKIGQTPWSIAEAISPIVNNQGSLRVHKTTAALLRQLGATPITAAEMTPRSGLVSVRDYTDDKKDQK